MHRNHRHPTDNHQSDTTLYPLLRTAPCTRHAQDLDNNAACDGKLAEVTGKIANLVGEVAKPPNTEKADAALDRLVGSLSDAKKALATIATVLNDTAAVKAAAAAAAAEADDDGGAVMLSVSATIPTAACGATKATACSVAYHANDVNGPMMKLLVRSAGGAFYGMAGVYECGRQRNSVV